MPLSNVTPGIFYQLALMSNNNLNHQCHYYFQMTHKHLMLARICYYYLLYSLLQSLILRF